MDFPYRITVSPPDAAFPQRQSVRRPTLQISLAWGGKSVTTLALVDSGADFCLFPASLGRELGMAFPNPRGANFSGSAKFAQMAYFEIVQASIWNIHEIERKIEFELYAGFCQTLEHAGMGLLGQDGFFSRFQVGFDHAGSRFTVI